MQPTSGSDKLQGPHLRAGPELKHHIKENREETNKALDDEIFDAWERRDTAMVHRLARRRAGTKIGTKKRDFRALPSLRPAAEDWKRAMAAEGPRGGFEAIEFNPVDFLVQGGGRRSTKPTRR